MRSVAAIPAIGLLAGCAVGLVVSGLPPLWLAAVLGASIPLGMLLAQRAAGLALAAMVGSGFCAGGVLLASHAWHEAWRPTLRRAFDDLATRERDVAQHGGRLPFEGERASVELTAMLRRDATPTAFGGVLLDLEVTRIAGLEVTPQPALRRRHAVQGGVLLTVVGVLGLERIDQWRAGRTIRAPALLRRPSRYLNPGVPDQELSLARRGATLVGSVKSGALVEVLSRGTTLAETAAEGRALVRRAIAFGVGRWSMRSAAIVAAILIGDRTGLGADVERRLQDAGTYHVIAISGGNIAILAMLALGVFRLAGRLGRAAMLTVALALTAYAYLVGGGPSVNRATLMAVVYFLGRALDLRGAPVNTLAVAAALLAAANPLAVADPGFLLTFGATLAILIAVPELRVPRAPRAVTSLASLFAASLAAEVALVPIGATFFSRVTMAGLVLNFAAIPLMAVAQLAGIAVTATSLISPALAEWAGWIAHLGAEGLVRSADLVDLVPALAWRVARPHPGLVVVYYTAVATAWVLWRQPRATGSRENGIARSVRKASALLAAGTLFCIAAEPARLLPMRGDGRLQVTFVDVGQGDAALIRFPGGQSVLIDAGGAGGASSFDVGDRVVAPVLRHMGVRRLQTVAVTHGDLDHLGGASALVREFRPFDVWEGVPVPPFEPLQALRREAQQSGSRWVSVQRNDEILIDGVRVVVRHPTPPDWERQDVRNDDSIVVEILWKDVSIVMTGDISREVERDIVSLFSPSPLRVMKVPHHGSLTSSSEAFVRALAPRVAVVSDGRGNPFGHPAADVLERYARVGAEIFRTDRDGAVVVDTDGTSLHVRAFTGRQAYLSKGLGRQKPENTKGYEGQLGQGGHENTKTRNATNEEAQNAVVAAH
jgi:competence protein ComEC